MLLYNHIKYQLQFYFRAETFLYITNSWQPAVQTLPSVLNWKYNCDESTSSLPPNCYRNIKRKWKAIPLRQSVVETTFVKTKQVLGGSTNISPTWRVFITNLKVLWEYSMTQMPSWLVVLSYEGRQSFKLWKLFHKKLRVWKASLNS